LIVVLTRCYWWLELARLRLISVVLLTAAAGFVLADGDTAHWLCLMWTLLASGLAAAGAIFLNQWMEAPRDARMERTRRRPIPSGRLPAVYVMVGGLTLVVAGPVVLAVGCGLLPAALAVSAIVIYVLAYTPLKMRTSFCTLAGACCGAIPPLIGWSAASGRLPYGAWALAAIVFAWQIPHFLALAWIHRRDYAAVGFKILPTVEGDAGTTSRMALIYSLSLLPLSLLAPLVGMAGWVYAFVALAAGAALAALSIHHYTLGTVPSARRLFLATVAYLPLVLGAMVIDHLTGRAQAP
jgi:protoheme IX farnesyltransferase